MFSEDTLLTKFDNDYDDLILISMQIVQHATLVAFLSGVPSDWEGSLGQHEERDIRTRPSLRRLNNPEEARNYDTSGIGAGTDRVDDDDNEEFVDNEPIINGNIVHEEDRFENTCVDVRKLSFHNFRSKLVTHFDIAYIKGEVRWPERNKVPNRSI